MRLLVCGPRNLDFTAMPMLTKALRQALLEAFPFDSGFVMAHGAARGADFLWEEALAFTYDRRPELWMPVRRMPAKWEKEGRAAGPLRNQRTGVRAAHLLACGSLERGAGHARHCGHGAATQGGGGSREGGRGSETDHANRQELT